MKLNVNFDGITSAAIKLQDGVQIDRKLKLYANTQLAKYCDKFVPASQNRILSETVQITPEFVRYPGPYAHFQYIGVVYEPNIPIFEGDTLVGFFSPPGKPKTKTDRKIHYGRDIHPQAQSHWDKAAMRYHKSDLTEDIRRFIVKKLGGKNNG